MDGESPDPLLEGLHDWDWDPPAPPPGWEIPSQWPSSSKPRPPPPTRVAIVDGWRSMRRLRQQVRRPGALDSNFKNYLRSMFPGARPERLQMLEAHCEDLQGRQALMEEALLYLASRIAEGAPFILPLHDPDSTILGGHYDTTRMYAMLLWINVDQSRWTCWTPVAIPPWVERKFEKEAWRYDKGHTRVLAARQRLARVVLGRLLRRAVARRAIALYWQEQTQRALCAPNGTGRTADKVAFASEFV